MRAMANQQWWSVSVDIGLVFGLLAAATSHAIFYSEYVRHFKTRSMARNMSLRGAVFAFCVFFALSLVTGYLLTHYVLK